MMSRTTLTQHAFVAAAISGLALCGGVAMTSQPAATAEAEPAEKIGKIDARSQEVLDKFIEATGGAEKIKKIKSTRQTGTFSMPAQGIQATMTIMAHAEHGVKAVVVLEGMGEIMQGVHAGQGWSVNPFAGPQLSEKEVTEQLLRDSHPHALLRYAKNYKSVTYAGTEEFEGQEAHKLTLTDWEGNESTEYFSPETGLMLGEKSVQVTEMGNMNVSVVYSEYKEFDGLTFPAKTVSSTAGQQQIMTTESMAFNDVKKDELTPPEVIQTMMADKGDL